MKALTTILLTLLMSMGVWGAECTNGNCSNGIGTYTWSSGSKYVGEWKDGKRYGQGTYTWPSGDKYVGEYKNDKRHGQGTFTWPNGDKYVGEYKDNKQHGQGTYTWADGEKYVGEYKDGKMHGQGTYTWADGTTKTGVWENGSYLGTKAEWNAKERTRKAKEEKERKAREEARQKYNRIFNACLLDKSSGVDMQVSSLRLAVEETCEAIATDPSWYESWKYN